MPFLPPEALADERSLIAASARAVELAREGQQRAGLALAAHAMRHAQSLETPRGQVEALNAAAIVHLMRGDAVCAAAAATDAVALARELEDAALLGHARLGLAMSRLALGLEEDHCARIESIVAACAGDRGLEVRARTGWGVALGDAGRFAEAERELRAALALTRGHESVITPARIVTNLANLARKRAMAGGGDAALACDEGIWHSHWAGSLATQEGNVAVMLDALAIHGALLVLQGRLAQGEALLREAVATGRAHRCRTPLAWIQCELGRLLLRRGDVEGARAAFADALEIAADIAPSRKTEAACRGLADVEERCGRWSEAFAWRARARAEAQAHRAACERLQGESAFAK